jgi:hypothetical protein
MIFGWLILIVAVIGRSVCDGIAITDADAQINDQTDVDRPGKQSLKFIHFGSFIRKMGNSIHFQLI